MDESRIGGREGFGSDRLRAELLHQLPMIACLYSGPVHTVAAENQAQLAICTTPGSPPLLIDLEQTTVLTSAVIHAASATSSTPEPTTLTEEQAPW